ncbi:hypothetical protein DMENIID0001_021300 [Sergentomyia squamirostris]
MDKPSTSGKYPRLIRSLGGSLNYDHSKGAGGTKKENDENCRHGASEKEDGKENTKESINPPQQDSPFSLKRFTSFSFRRPQRQEKVKSPESLSRKSLNPTKMVQPNAPVVVTSPVKSVMIKRHPDTPHPNVTHGITLPEKWPTSETISRQMFFGVSPLSTSTSTMATSSSREKEDKEKEPSVHKLNPIENSKSEEFQNPTICLLVSPPQGKLQVPTFP